MHDTMEILQSSPAPFLHGGGGRGICAYNASWTETIVVCLLVESLSTH